MYALFDMSEPRTIHIVLYSKTGILREITKSARNVDLLAVFVDVLETQQMTVADIEGVAVVVGEGTFTSTRVAVTVANGLAYARGMRVLAVSLEQTSDVPTLVAAFADVTPGQFISATYSGPPRIHSNTP